MDYATSDLHLSHANVIRFDNRPFKDVTEMNEALVRNWNEVVRDEDNIYCIGDFSFGGAEETEKYLRRLNGHKHLILGNHDMDANYNIKPKLEQVFKKYFETIAHLKSVTYKGYMFDMCHYPIEEWHWQHKGKIMLHGHSHNTAQYNAKQQYRRYDVGVRANNYYPVSLDQIISIVKDRPTKTHHDDRQYR